MECCFENDNTFCIVNFDENKIYSVKDLMFLAPVGMITEENSSDIFVLLNSEKYNLAYQETSGDVDIFRLDLKDKVFNGGATDFKMVTERTNISDGVTINFSAYTPFTAIYNLFFEKVTDDMYMELTREDTYRLLKGLLINALQYFEFPRVNIYDFDGERGCYNIALSYEEMDIIATYMVMHWLGQQLASVENTRMKYSGSDFKFTSQANHMAKLQNLKKDYERMGFHLQRLYKRRKADDKGVMRSTFGSIMEASTKNKR